jgi:hypothetical protein
MATNLRRASRAQVPFRAAARLHLLHGHCLIAGGCGLCEDLGLDAAPCRWPLRLGLARNAWAMHRADLVAEWAAHLDSIDAPGMPCFAQVVFDGAALPPVRAFWPPAARALRATIERNVAAWAAHTLLYGPPD